MPGLPEERRSTTMAKPALRPPKKKQNPLKAAGIETVDYKDAALLRKFISDRGKIRARRVTGVSVQDRRSTRLNSSHVAISYAVFCLKKKKRQKFISERR